MDNYWVPKRSKTKVCRECGEKYEIPEGTITFDNICPECERDLRGW